MAAEGQIWIYTELDHQQQQVLLGLKFFMQRKCNSRVSSANAIVDQPVPHKLCLVGREYEM